ncbi:hypothetical protein LUW76_10670 [Actinomadura madurae]|uniref:hypothetical protein n=1 Tax=Actinomadura madurae TaxID=1993 RepID=UPI0020271F84|nr:hypothetical protein [Actinomadura madurae]URM94747.1 hypothetical protein LUW76_10670 [Actinomadura madurae]
MEHRDRAELAAFLRRWRARVQPSEVGLERGRRRTPGLRRQEVANLAGMSVDYYVRLEGTAAVEADARRARAGAAADRRRAVPPALPGG